MKILVSLCIKIVLESVSSHIKRLLFSGALLGFLVGLSIDYQFPENELHDVLINV